MNRRRACLSLAFATSLALGCTGEFVFESPGGGGTPPAADSGPLGAARLFFDDNVSPMLTLLRPSGACTTCHSENTPFAEQGAPELFGSRQTPEITYNSLLASGFVGTSPENSAFRNVVHDAIGESFCSGPGTPYDQCLEDELTILAEWIQLENQ